MNIVVFIGFFIGLGISSIVVGFLIGKKLGELISEIVESPLFGYVSWGATLFVWFVIIPLIGQGSLAYAMKSNVLILIDNPVFLGTAIPSFMLKVGLVFFGIGIVVGRSKPKATKSNLGNNGETSGD